MDEFSMVGNEFFNFISLKWQEIKGNKLPHRRMNVVAVIDIFQLKPVYSSYIFQALKVTMVY